MIFDKYMQKPGIGGNFKVDQLKCFADDITVIMEETTQNLKRMKEIFEGFFKISGLKINEKKD